ncbi:hypothetical protein Acr_00g0062530 [Actinidia rufa]|uniref:Uncharacterized protein n=1 Tax=Actinidia rufa TaxID=165716 RepID=A0A7J0DQY1_9ERIC|nr:hypothetical protein Acr_00g0062530 [Actinidia rufa]
MVDGDIGGEAEGDIREKAAVVGHANESGHSTDVSRPDVPSRGDSVEFVGTIGEEMRKIFLHASDLDLLRWSRESDRDPFLGPAPSSLSSSSSSRLGSQSDSRLFPELRSDAMFKRIKLNELAKVAAQKATTPSSKGMVISEGSEMASKKRASDDGSKGKQVAPLPEAKKIKIGSDAHTAPTRPPVVPEEGSSARRTLGEALGPQASVMASAATAEKILAGPVILGSSLAVRSRDFSEGALNQRALVESSEMEMAVLLVGDIDLELWSEHRWNINQSSSHKRRQTVVVKIWGEQPIVELLLSLGTRPRLTSRATCATLNKSKWPGVSWRRESRNGQLPCLDRILVEIDQAKYLPRLKVRKRHHFALDQPKSTPGEFRSTGGKLRSFGEVPVQDVGLVFTSVKEGSKISLGALMQQRWDVTGWVSGDVLGGTLHPHHPNGNGMRKTCLYNMANV